MGERISLIEFLADAIEFFDGQADADQPTGCSHPIPNTAMRLQRQAEQLLERAEAARAVIASATGEAADLARKEGR